MSRIRSLHPGQWTDEDFVACSYPARLLALALRNEADDNGVFEWKPLAIKMRLFPADNVDVAALLAELSENRQVASFEHSGKRYGVIRNFRRWQRPDKPKSWLPIPDEWRAFAGLVVEPKEPAPPPVSDHSPTGRDQSANSSAEVGCRRKEEGGNPEDGGADAPPPLPPNRVATPPPQEPGDLKARLFGDCLAWFALATGQERAALRPLLGRWVKDHGEPRVLEAFIAAQREQPVDPKGWIIGALKARARNQRDPNFDPQDASTWSASQIAG